jgi:hypothetical protein
MSGERRNSHSQEVWRVQVAAWKTVGGVLLFWLPLALCIETGSRVTCFYTDTAHCGPVHLFCLRLQQTLEKRLQNVCRNTCRVLLGDIGEGGTAILKWISRKQEIARWWTGLFWLGTGPFLSCCGNCSELSDPQNSGKCLTRCGTLSFPIWNLFVVSSLGALWQRSVTS